MTASEIPTLQPWWKGNVLSGKCLPVQKKLACNPHNEMLKGPGSIQTTVEGIVKLAERYWGGKICGIMNNPFRALV
jgi:hypothetical protein